MRFALALVAANVATAVDCEVDLDPEETKSEIGEPALWDEGIWSIEDNESDSEDNEEEETNLG